MPGVIIADPSGAASALSAEGELALARGDTALAQQKHAEAGQILERRMKSVSRAREKHFLRFLAATQFYKGGHYQHASELAEKIDPKLLDARARELLPPFLKDVRQRSSPGYLARMKAKVDVLWSARDWNAILTLLAEHQFILTPGGSAWVRGVCCLQLGKLKASAIFFAESYRDPVARVFALQSSCYQVFEWATTNNRSTAAEYVRMLTEFVPNAATFVASAFTSYTELVHAPESEWTRLANEQIAAMDGAIDTADTLLSELGEATTIRQLLAIGAGAAALTARWIGDLGRADRFKDYAIRVCQDRATSLRLIRLFEDWERPPSAPSSDSLMASVADLVQQAKNPAELPDFLIAA